MKKSPLVILSALFMALPLSAAFALSLQEARSTGQVGEGNNGYVVALQTTPETQRLVADVNAKRRAEYGRISQSNGQTVDTVAKLAAGQIVKQLEAGNSYQDASGSWIKK